MPDGARLVRGATGDQGSRYAVAAVGGILEADRRRLTRENASHAAHHAQPLAEFGGPSPARALWLCGEGGKIRSGPVLQKARLAKSSPRARLRTISPGAHDEGVFARASPWDER